MESRFAHLDALESQSIYILREAYRKFKRLAMLWSIGKDSSVMLWLLRKAFFGHIPVPCVHVDTSYKIPEMIAFRDRLAKEWGINLIVGQNREVLERGETFPNGRITRVECCSLLKKDALQAIIEEKDLKKTFRLSLLVSGVTKKEPGQKSDISRHATKTSSGTLRTSRRNCGTNLRPTLIRGRTSAFIRCCTGPKSTCGSTSTASE